MFEELMNDFINKRNNYIDELSINLLKRAGVPISENATNFELIMVYNDLQKRGLRLKMSKTHDNKDMLAVYRIEDLHDSIL